jgi:NADH-quinone oxidoreductase subunit L
MHTLLPLILIPPLAGTAVNGIFGRRFSRALVGAIAIACSGLAMVFALLAAWTYSHSAFNAAVFTHDYFTWIQAGAFRAGFLLYYDRLTLVMTCTVTVVAFLIHIYSTGYMAHEGGFYRFFTYLNLFLFMMLTLVLAGNYPLMFVGWEGVGLCSYLLIGFYFTKKSAADAGKKAFVTTRIGDVGFTLAVALLFWNFHTVDFSQLFPAVAGLQSGEMHSVLFAAGLLLFLGAAGKSAQIPLYVWLPDAMEGPTPVSALIHAATMVTAGVYLVARSSVIFAHAPQALETVAIIGCVTAFFAATIALTQNDLKRMLAYSTISQLGYMFLGCGAGLFATGVFHLMTHAAFKSLLFLAAGSVMHAMSGELDMRKMGGLRARLKTTYWTFLIATLAISGVPGLAGFFSKDEILSAAFSGPLGRPWLWALATLTAGMTAFYMFRGLFMTFHGESRVPHELEHHVHESPGVMTRPLMVLALFSIIAGYVSIPAPLGGGEGFDKYLAPVFENSEAFLRSTAVHPAQTGVSGLLLMVISMCVAGLGILLAWWLYLKSPALPEKMAASFSGFYRVLVNKYYVDEFLNATLINPMRVISDKVLWRVTDAGLIDGVLVNGTGAATAGVGAIFRRLQSGNLRSYAAWVLLGALCWLGYVLLWRA